MVGVHFVLLLQFLQFFNFFFFFGEAYNTLLEYHRSKKQYEPEKQQRRIRLDTRSRRTFWMRRQSGPETRVTCWNTNEDRVGIRLLAGTFCCRQVAMNERTCYGSIRTLNEERDLVKLNPELF